MSFVARCACAPPPLPSRVVSPRPSLASAVRAIAPRHVPVVGDVLSGGCVTVWDSLCKAVLPAWFIGQLWPDGSPDHHSGGGDHGAGGSLSLFPSLSVRAVPLPMFAALRDFGADSKPPNCPCSPLYPVRNVDVRLRLLNPRCGFQVPRICCIYSMYNLTFLCNYAHLGAPCTVLCTGLRSPAAGLQCAQHRGPRAHPPSLVPSAGSLHT